MMPCGRAISNRDLNATELARREVALESLPTKLMVVLTRECNLRCIMCPRCLDRPLTLPYALAVKATELLPGLEKIDWQGG